MSRIDNPTYRRIQAIFDNKIRDMTINFYEFLQKVGTIDDRETYYKVDQKIKQYRRAFCEIESLVDALTLRVVPGGENNIYIRFNKITNVFEEMIIIQLKVCEFVRSYGDKQKKEKKLFEFKIGKKFKFSC